MATYTTTVTVRYSSGQPARQAKVVLHIYMGGMTRPVYTNNDGVAQIGHDSFGTATIYVNGTKHGTVSPNGSAQVIL